MLIHSQAPATPIDGFLRRARMGPMSARSRARRGVLVVATIAVLITGCSSGTVVNTGETPATETNAQAATPSSTRPSNDDLANAFDFYAQSNGRLGYFFTSPSKRWVCAIFPREIVGCQSSTGSAIPVKGAPDSVPDAQGKDSAPNAIQVDRVTDAQFSAVDPPGYGLVPGPAVVLPLNKVLIVAGFRCNVQEASGISCLSELTGKGFTFSADGYTLQYTDLPA
jgi:hypothetical protein